MRHEACRWQVEAQAGPKAVEGAGPKDAGEGTPVNWEEAVRGEVTQAVIWGATGGDMGATGGFFPCLAGDSGLTDA